MFKSNEQEATINQSEWITKYGLVPPKAKFAVMGAGTKLVNGYYEEIPFKRFGFTKVRDFVKVFKSDAVKCDVLLFKTELSNIGLKCNGFITNNIVCNINSINTLSK